MYSAELERCRVSTGLGKYELCTRELTVIGHYFIAIGDSLSAISNHGQTTAGS